MSNNKLHRLCTQLQEDYANSSMLLPTTLRANAAGRQLPGASHLEPNTSHT